MTKNEKLVRGLYADTGISFHQLKYTRHYRTETATQKE